MASLKYSANSSLQTVTLGSGYTSGSGSMSLTAGHGARLPASGDFWLAYDNGAGVVRLFKVTARSTDTLTVTPDATEGSGDGNISSGETLRWALTAAALDQLRTDLCGYGTYANLPATCKIGDRYITSDTPYTFVATATNTWQALYRGQAVTIPPSSGWTEVNKGGSDVITYSGAINVFGVSAASENNILLVRTAPTPPYTIEAAIQFTMPYINFSSTGLCFRQSSDGKLVRFAHITDSAYKISHTYLSSPTTGVSNGKTASWWPRETLWMRIEDDNTDRNYYLSPDGVNWFEFYTETRTSNLTADQVGFLVGKASGDSISSTLIHWRSF